MTQAFWVIVVVGFLALLQSRYFTSVGFRKVFYRRSINKRAVFEGEKIELIEELSNNKLTPVPWLRVESKLSPWLRFRSQENLEIFDNRYHKSVFFLRSYCRIVRRHEITCMRRGYYDLSITALTAGDLFGMAAYSKDVHGDAKLFVYPSLIGDDELPEDALRWEGDLSVRRWICPDPILINGIREYQRGDSRKDIHWKASARSGKLQVKTHDFTVSPRVLIVFNVDPVDQFWGYLSDGQQSSMEYSIRCIATLLTWAINQGMDAGFYTNAASAAEENQEIAVPPACSDAQQEKLLSTLAGLLLQQQESIYRTLERMVEDQVEDADVLVFSAFWNEALERRCEAVRARGNTVRQIEIQREAVDFEKTTAAAV